MTQTTSFIVFSYFCECAKGFGGFNCEYAIDKNLTELACQNQDCIDATCFAETTMNKLDYRLLSFLFKISASVAISLQLAPLQRNNSGLKIYQTDGIGSLLDKIRTTEDN